MVATYVASESAPGSSWGSFTYSLTLNEDGSANFYCQNVADRDTDSTYNHFGHWRVEGGIVVFQAGTTRGKMDYDSEKVSEYPLVSGLVIYANYSKLDLRVFKSSLFDRPSLQMNFSDSGFSLTTA